MNRVFWMGLVVFSSMPLGRSADAFTVQSAFTTGCHETVTTAAFFQAAIRFPPFPDEFVPNGDWEDTLEVLLPNLQDLPRGQRFVLFSLLTGVRAPDSEGYSVTNLAALRAIQGDPTTQYVHCLRSETDDYDEGNQTALAGCRDAIFTEILEATNFANEPIERQIIKVPFAIDNYGTFEVEAWALAFYLGRALHTFQDSFTHTLRSPNMREVVHVMNYEAAISGELDEARDGMAHSAAADACELVSDSSRGIVNRDRVLAAMEASTDLIRGFVRFIEARTKSEGTQGDEEIVSVLLKWLRVADPATLGDFEECGVDNDYCNSPWLEIARRSPAGPLLGCRTTGPVAGAGWGWLGLLVAVGLFVNRKVRMSLIVMGALLATGCGAADEINPLVTRVIFPIGGLGDDSLADSMLSGIIFARSGAEFDLEQIEPENRDQAEAQFERWLEDRSARQLIIVGGSVFQGFVEDRNCDFGSATVLLLDGSSFSCRGLRSVTYRVYGPSFLAGVAAVSDPDLNPTRTAGIIGGTDLPPVREFIDGFEAGVAYAGGTLVGVEFISDNPDVGFSSPTLARDVADVMRRQAGVIFAVAGGSSSGVADALEAALTTTSTAPTYFMGVDIDHSAIHSAVTIGSVLKRVDETVAESILQGVVGAFAAGDVRLGFQDRRTELVLHPRKANRVLSGDCAACDPFDAVCYRGCTTLDDVVRAAMPAAIEAATAYEAQRP